MIPEKKTFMKNYVTKNRNKLNRSNAGTFDESDDEDAVSDDGDDEIYHRRDVGLQTAKPFDIYARVCSHKRPVRCSYIDSLETETLVKSVRFRLLADEAMALFQIRLEFVQSSMDLVLFVNLN